jgi:hypothetical protein
MQLNKEKKKQTIKIEKPNKTETTRRELTKTQDNIERQYKQRKQTKITKQEKLRREKQQRQ